MRRFDKACGQGGRARFAGHPDYCRRLHRRSRLPSGRRGRPGAANRRLGVPPGPTDPPGVRTVPGGNPGAAARRRRLRPAIRGGNPGPRAAASSALPVGLGCPLLLSRCSRRASFSSRLSRYSRTAIRTRSPTWMSPGRRRRSGSAIRTCSPTCALSAAALALRRECSGPGDYMRAVDVRPVRGSRLPAGRALDTGEIVALFAACNDDTNAGTRDAAMLSLLYGGGLRRAEAARHPGRRRRAG